MDIKLNKPQATVMMHPARHKVLIAGRRTGKTFCALVWLWKLASETPNGVFYYVSPTYAMSKSIAWKDLKLMFGDYLRKTNEAELYAELYNGATIHLKGAENQNGLRGVSLSGLVMDEFAFMDKDVWDYVLAPACSDKEAPVLFISTPSGWNWAKEFYDRGVEMMDDHWAGWQFTTSEGGNVSEKELAERKRSLPPKVYAQEYLACHLPYTEVLTEKGVKQIKDVLVGDYVLHINNEGERVWVKVLNSGATVHKQVCTACLENGDVIQSSPDHKYKV
jgi:hypothetical protein